MKRYFTEVERTWISTDYIYYDEETKKTWVVNLDKKRPNSDITSTYSLEDILFRVNRKVWKEIKNPKKLRIG